MIRYLVQHGADPNQGSTDKCSPLKQAARWGHLDAVAALVESGTDVNAGDGTDQGTALSILVEEKQDDPGLVRYLLRHGARPDCRNARGLTALMVAIEHGRERSVMELPSARADVSAQDRDGDSVLAWAAMVGTARLASELLARGAMAETPNSSGMTPLFHAAHAESAEIVELLLSHGASPNPVESRYGDSALMRAANGGHTAVVRTLLDRGAPIDKANLKGLTALHMAARNGEDEVVRLLVDRGADLSRVDREGRTAEALATKNGHGATAALLGRLGATAPPRPNRAVPRHHQHKTSKPRRSVLRGSWSNEQRRWANRIRGCGPRSVEPMVAYSGGGGSLGTNRPQRRIRTLPKTALSHAAQRQY